MMECYYYHCQYHNKKVPLCCNEECLATEGQLIALEILLDKEWKENVYMPTEGED